MSNHIKSILVYILIIFLGAFSIPKDFLATQKTFPNVRTAFKEKEKLISEKLKKSKIKANELNILIVAFKAERQLEIYAKKKTDSTYKKIETYNICSTSGALGPKRKHGDSQVPEGFYHIDRFNPTSNFYLSLGLNYPNESDKLKSDAENPGGDIFIHGSCVTIGCMPMTDEKIKEIYLYAILAREYGQMKIPVYVFPFRMSEKNFSSYKELYKSNSSLINFWLNLKIGYAKFEQSKMELDVSTDKIGDYVYK